MSARASSDAAMQRHVDLSGVGMTLSGWEYAEKWARVRAGTLTELGRLILWSPKKGKLEPSHFSVVPFKNLKNPPARHRGPDEAELEGQDDCVHPVLQAACRYGVEEHSVCPV